MKIAYGNSRKDRKWKNSDITFEDFKRRVSRTTYTTETVEEYRAMSKAEQANIKDVGGFVGGHLRDGRRRKGMVLSRSLLALDMDYGTPRIWEDKISKMPYKCCVYSTHKHTADHPRYRLIIPLARDISEAEYPAVARQVAKEIGIDLFDDSTYEAHRLMYWPTTSVNGEFIFREKGGDLLNPDVYLALYDDWQDMATWPVSSRQSEVKEHRTEKAEDPLKKKGLVGAFCRAYSMEEAIETFLSDVYEPSAIPGRYDYKPASSSAGVVIYDNKFMYSHHATDPLCGLTLNAFDAVRLHKFGGLDAKCPEDTQITQLPSYKAMLELARDDSRVKSLIVEENQELAAGDFDDHWLDHLSVDKQGQIESTLQNIAMVIRCDPKLVNISFNLFKGTMDVKGSLPWEQAKPGWNDSDLSSLNLYLAETYNIYAPAKVKDALLSIGTTRKFHPIMDYFDSLLPWDQVPRIERLLVDYLGAADNPYTRAVITKMMIAAVARVYEPGTKFDSVLILNGPQGIGKSTFFAKLGREWFSDSLTLTDMRDKAGAEKLQSYWILELGELAGMKKADVETVKSFISRTDDKYRASYGVNVESHPRQCVIVGSTNAEAGFLRDITGNRRFWPVTVTGESEKKPWDLTNEDVDRLWAEALWRYRNGEFIYLDRELAKYAQAEQKNAMETDEREGLVKKYLDKLLPENWEGMDLTARRLFLEGDAMASECGPGTVQRTHVSNIEIYAECFGGDMTKMRKADSYEIAGIMDKIDGWSKSPRRVVTHLYGRQRVYERDEGKK